MARYGGKPILRWVLVGIVLCVAIGPTLPLVVSTLGQESTQPVWTDAFSKSVKSTLWLGAGVSFLSLLIGLPLGLLTALYRFPTRHSLVLFQLIHAGVALSQPTRLERVLFHPRVVAVRVPPGQTQKSLTATLAAQHMFEFGS